MRPLLALGLLASAAFLASGQAGAAEVPGPEPSLVRLTHGSLVVAVVPGLGARVVELRTLSGENLLNADPRYWSEPFPKADLATPFAPWNGHTYWVGPQSEWWTQQELDPARRKARAIWPPDPFHETARYAVRELSQTRVSLESPPSPISGLVRRLDVEILPPRTVRLRVTATNVRATPVAWDFWSNTRVRPEGWAYVRLAADGVRKVDGPGDGSPAYPHLLRQGFLVSPPGEKALPSQASRTSKAFLRPASGEVDYFRGHDLLRKRTADTSEGRLHPEQALVEIYRAAGREPADDLLELEMHGPYETLAPGGAMSFEETWELVDYPGPSDPDSHLDFLEGLHRPRPVPPPR